MYVCMYVWYVCVWGGGGGKRSSHSNMLSALDIPTLANVKAHYNLSLSYRICQTDTPAIDSVLYMLQNYIVTGCIIPGSLIARIIDHGSIKGSFDL